MAISLTFFTIFLNPAKKPGFSFLSLVRFSFSKLLSFCSQSLFSSFSSFFLFLENNFLKNHQSFCSIFSLSFLSSNFFSHFPSSNSFSSLASTDFFLSFISSNLFSSFTSSCLSSNIPKLLKNSHTVHFPCFIIFTLCSGSIYCSIFLSFFSSTSILIKIISINKKITIYIV